MDRAEYLAVSLLLEAEAGAKGREVAELERAGREETLLELVRQLAAEHIETRDCRRARGRPG